MTEKSGTQSLTGDPPELVSDAETELVTDEEMDFDRALAGLRATGASPDTYKLVETLAAHGRDEGALLSEYARLSADANDDVRYVVDLILQDERRHHRLLVQMANAVAWGPLGDGRAPVTPSLGFRMTAELLARTKELRRAEQADRRRLRAIRRRFRPFADSTLWTLMIDQMLLDTKKHITMLRFLERHARRR